MTSCDILMAFRRIVRAACTKRSLVASFLPKVRAGAGSGLHYHFSLWENGKNRTSVSKDKLGKETKYFIAGVLAHLNALQAITAPTQNSCRRLLPSHWAGAYCCWGVDNREAAIRVTSNPQGTGMPLHVEFKTSDATSNIYLSVGSFIACGLLGISKKMALGEPVNVDPHTLSEEQLAELGVTRLPENAEAALDCLDDDLYLCEALGPRLARAYIASHRCQAAFFKDKSLEEEVKCCFDEMYFHFTAPEDLRFGPMSNTCCTRTYLEDYDNDGWNGTTILLGGSNLSKDDKILGFSMPFAGVLNCSPFISLKSNTKVPLSSGALEFRVVRSPTGNMMVDTLETIAGPTNIQRNPWAPTGAYARVEVPFPNIVAGFPAGSHVGVIITVPSNAFEQIIAYDASAGSMGFFRCPCATPAPTVATSSSPPPTPTVVVTTTAPPAPTFSPTSTSARTTAPPTPEPPTPTAFPSQNPTSSPTFFPTMQPSFWPSPFPSYWPSPFPTPFPTPHPTDFPSPRPTPFPSTFPSPAPTPQPITPGNPTPLPTPPTSAPTPLPTPLPTINPTPFPTHFPTEFPSFSPTTPPAAAPTFAPSTTIATTTAATTEVTTEATSSSSASTAVTSAASTTSTVAALGREGEDSGLSDSSVVLIVVAMFFLFGILIIGGVVLLRVLYLRNQKRSDSSRGAPERRSMLRGSRTAAGRASRGSRNSRFASYATIPAGQAPFLGANEMAPLNRANSFFDSNYDDFGGGHNSSNYNGNNGGFRQATFRRLPAPPSTGSHYENNPAPGQRYEDITLSSQSSASRPESYVSLKQRQLPTPSSPSYRTLLHATSSSNGYGGSTTAFASDSQYASIDPQLVVPRPLGNYDTVMR